MHTGIKRKQLLLATAAMMAAAVPAIASAQTDEGGKIETVIVTARKQSEDLLKVPVAVTAFTGNDLAVRGVDSLDDLTDFTPGLADNHNSASGARSDRSFQQLIIRGMNPSAVQNPTTSIFINGVPVASPDFIQNLNDVDHVDVLKGPQSAFFGRETFAGAVNVTTKAASNTFSGDASAEVGGRRTQVFSGDINVPIIEDKLSVRAGYTYDHHDGSYQNAANPGQTLGDQTTKTIHFGITARPIENLTIKGFGMIMQDDDGPSATGILIASPGAAFNQGNCTVAGSPYFCGKLPGLISSVSPAQNTTLSQGTNFVNASQSFLQNPGGVLKGGDLVNHFGLKRNAYHGDLNIEYDIPSLGLSLTYLGGFNHDNYSELSDLSNESGAANGQYPGYTGFPYEVQSAAHDYSHEFRIATNPNKPYRALVGVSYVEAWTVQDGGLAFIGPKTATSFTGAAKSETTGVFFSLAYDVMRQLTINFDGRYQQDKELGYSPAGPLIAQGTSNDFLPRVSVQYKFMPNVMAYFTYSQGVNPGLFNESYATLPTASKQELSSLGITANETVKPEDLTNYEVGVKGRFFDGRATLSADVYYDKWKNQIVQKNYVFLGTDPANPYNVPGSTVYVANNTSIDSYTYYDNSASSTAKGVEVEADFIPIEHLTVDLAGAINDTQYDQFTCTSCTPYDALSGGYPGISVKGKYLPNSPKDSFTAGVEYANRASILTASDWFARVDYVYKDGVYIQSDNVTKTPNVNLVNLRAGINWTHFSAEAFVDNLLNNKSYTSGFSNVNFAGGFGYNVVEVGLPQLITAGVKFKYKF